MLTKAEFDAARQRMVKAWYKGDLADAQAALNIVLSDGSPSMKAECLFYYGMMAEERSNLAEAQVNWSSGLQHAREGSFLRFQLETSLGGAAEQQGQPAEALKWFRGALETCCEGDEFSGNKALSGYLRLTGGKVDPADETVVSCVAEKSWQVIGLPGAPDPNDWVATAARLAKELESRASESNDLN
jgi:hypothetical protein